jgi:hypothetical protein
VEVRDATASIDGNLTTPDEHLSELFPPSLHARLHAGYRDAGVSGGVRLGESAQRRELDGRAIRFRQPLDHRRQTRRQFGLGLRDGSSVRFGREVCLQCISSAVATLPCPQGVPKRIPRDLKQPRLGSVRRAEAAQMLDDAEEDLLEQVVCVNAWGYPPREKSSEGRREIRP